MHESWKSAGPRITTDSYHRNRFMDPKFQKENDKKTPKEGHTTLQNKSTVEELTDRLKNMKIAYVWDDMITCYGCGERGHRRNNCPQNQVNTVDEDEEEEEDDGISYTEEQAELINTLLAQIEQINKAVQSEKRPYEKKKPEAQRKKPEVVIEIPQRQVKFEAPEVSMKEVKEKPI